MFKLVSLPLRTRGHFLDEPVERGQVSFEWFKIFEQIANNFADRFDSSGNIILNRYATASRPTQPVDDVVIIDSDLGLPIWFDGSDWRDFAGNVV